VIAPLVRSLRPAQWSKNVFVLAPLVFGSRLGDAVAVGRALLAFAVFCCAASAVYLVNDLRDREEDRRHPLKRLRPLAAGTLKPAVAVVAIVVLVAAVAALAVQLGVGFAVTVGAYLLMNLLYTIWLKHMVILDVMCISFSYVLRVVAGAQATRVEVSSWLFLCTTFLALFLAFSKRVVTASSVVSYALYAVAPETVAKFHTRWLLYTVPLVLFGIFRYLYLIYQRSDQRNPTEAILHDAPFLINIALWGLVVIWIVYGRGLWSALLPGTGGR
jgi:4-hydroxybenzoate polyprenyltransferase